MGAIGTRLPERVALVDFWWGNPPEGWRDGGIYSLGVQYCSFVHLTGSESEAVKRAHSFLFPGYHQDARRTYPLLLSLDLSLLTSIVVDIMRGERGEVDEETYQEHYSKLTRPTGAKISPDETRAILVSGDSRSYVPGPTLFDIDWDLMHYDEPLLTKEDLKSIKKLDEYAFLKAIGAKYPKPASDT